MSLLGERLLAVHDALTRANLPHAIGGALALAYCTIEPRGTRDLDVNVFVPQARFREVADALPDGIQVTPADVAIGERDGQIRLMWGETPVDLFLNNVPFHSEVEKRVREVDFMGRRIPVLGCTSLAVFKAMFDRTKDWADIEAMIEKGSIDLDDLSRWIEEMTGSDSPQACRLRELRGFPRRAESAAPDS